MRLIAWFLCSFVLQQTKAPANQQRYQLFASAKLYNKNDGYQQINANNHYKEVAL